MAKISPDPKDCLDIVIKDLQLHAQKARNPNSLGRQIAKTVNSRKAEGRAYANDIEAAGEGMKLSVPIEMEKLYDLARKQGKKYVRFFILKNSTHVKLGEDAIKSLLSKKNLQNTKKVL